jgi:DNA-binding PadR family transcriptional regulator
MFDNSLDRGTLRRNWLHVLVALADGDLHGAAIARDVLDQTEGDLRLWPATLYRTLDEMASAGLIAELDEEERPDDASARLRYYRTTPLGRAELRAELERMESVVGTARRRLRRAPS